MKYSHMAEEEISYGGKGKVIGNETDGGREERVGDRQNMRVGDRMSMRDSYQMNLYM